MPAQVLRLEESDTSFLDTSFLASFPGHLVGGGISGVRTREGRLGRVGSGTALDDTAIAPAKT